VTSRRPAPTTLAFHASRIVVDVGVLIVMLAMSLPFVTTAGGNRSSMLLDALPTVLLLGPIFLITLIPDHTRPIPRVLGWASLVLGLAAFPYAVVKYLDSSVLARTLGGGVGMGARLLVLGSFVTLVGIVIGLARSFLGLEAGGTPGRTKAVRTRPGPAGDADEEIEDDQPSDDVALVATAPMPTAPPPTGRPARSRAPGPHVPAPRRTRSGLPCSTRSRCRSSPSRTASRPSASRPRTPPNESSTTRPEPCTRPGRW
jgi:hypothetical protein